MCMISIRNALQPGGNLHADPLDEILVHRELENVVRPLLHKGGLQNHWKTPWK